MTARGDARKRLHEVLAEEAEARGEHVRDGAASHAAPEPVTADEIADLLHLLRHQGMPCYDPPDCHDTDKAAEHADALLARYDVRRKP